MKSARPGTSPQELRKTLSSMAPGDNVIFTTSDRYELLDNGLFLNVDVPGRTETFEGLILQYTTSDIRVER